MTHYPFNTYLDIAGDSGFICTPLQFLLRKSMLLKISLIHILHMEQVCYIMTFQEVGTRRRNKVESKHHGAAKECILEQQRLRLV